MPLSPLRAPAPFALPAGRTFSDEFHRIRALAREWIHAYYDVEHLRRSGDWLLAIDPVASEPLVIAALTHDMERAVPGGPVIDKVRMEWDDLGYNTAHCARSAAIVAQWLMDQRAPKEFVLGVQQPIVEHEFGGSAEGDVIQAADSISFLETNRGLCARWVANHECTLEKSRDKLRWMCDRVRLERARSVAREQFDAALIDVDERLSRAMKG